MSEVYMLMLGYPRVIKEKADDVNGHPSVYGTVLAVFFDYAELKDFIRKLANVVDDVLANVPIEEAARRNELPVELTKRALLLAGLYRSLGADQSYAVLKYANGQYDLIDEVSLFKDSFTMPVHA
jgi:hypothetical protein